MRRSAAIARRWLQGQQLEQQPNPAQGQPNRRVDQAEGGPRQDISSHGQVATAATPGPRSTRTTSS
jgi:hypothetical protein